MAKKKTNNLWYVIGGIMILILLIVIIIIQVKNAQRNAEIEEKLQRVQAEKEFCDSLEISISNGAVPYGYPAGVNYAFCSNKDTTAKSIVTLKNGLTDEANVNLYNGSCMLQQIQLWAGYTGRGYQGGVNCEDIQSIKIVSDRCPQVKDIVTNMNEITCGL
jgi:hypothetical protein